MKDAKSIEVMAERCTAITTAETEIKLAKKRAEATFFTLDVKMLERNSSILLPFILGI